MGPEPLRVLHVSKKEFAFSVPPTYVVGRSLLAALIPDEDTWKSIPRLFVELGPPDPANPGAPMVTVKNLSTGESSQPCAVLAAGAGGTAVLRSGEAGALRRGALLELYGGNPSRPVLRFCLDPGSSPSGESASEESATDDAIDIELPATQLGGDAPLPRRQQGDALADFFNNRGVTSSR